MLTYKILRVETEFLRPSFHGKPKKKKTPKISTYNYCLSPELDAWECYNCKLEFLVNLSTKLD